MIDSASLYNLEIELTLSGNKSPTLLSVLDQTASAAGSRLLRRWLIDGVVCRQSGGETEKLWHRISSRMGIKLWLLARPFNCERIESINTIESNLITMLPDLKIIIAHGQMGEGELENAMVAFNAGEADILLCTTIVESGLDIPRVNTI